MHWLGYNDAVSQLNEAKTRIFQPTANFEIYLYFAIICLPACLSDLVAVGVGLQKFHTIKVMVADLRNCCSEDDLPTVLLSIFPLPCFSLFLWQSVNLTFKGDNGFSLLHHTNKTGLDMI